jgi:hypothetical protein
MIALFSHLNYWIPEAGLHMVEHMAEHMEPMYALHASLVDLADETALWDTQVCLLRATRLQTALL